MVGEAAPGEKSYQLSPATGERWEGPSCCRLCTRDRAHALNADINFVDTADVYSAGESEEIVGKAPRGHREDVVWPVRSTCRWART